MKSTVKTVIICAIFAAVGFALDRFLGVTVPLFGVKSLSVNISFVPIFLAGFLFGPVWGALVGGVQDILCVLLVPLGPFIPGITISTMLAGAFAGLFKALFIKNHEISSLRKTDASKNVIKNSVFILSQLIFFVLLFLPSISFTIGETSHKLSAWQTLFQSDEYRSAILAILGVIDTGDNALLAYSSTKIADVSANISFGLFSAAIFGLLSFISHISKNRRILALITAFFAFISAGISAATIYFYVPKIMGTYEITTDVTILPHIFIVLSIIPLIICLTNFDFALFKLSIFCLITSSLVSILNSYWISLAYTSVSFWVYLLPRLAAAIFIGVPLYTALLWLIMKNAVPRLKKAKLLF